MFDTTYKVLQKDNYLSNNNEYYINIFKKTERIVSAIFYVLSFIETNDANKGHLTHVSDQTTRLHQLVLDSLQWTESDLERRRIELQHAYVSTDSLLRITVAARVLTTDVVEPLLGELDLVMRYLRNHFNDGSAGVVSLAGPAAQPATSPVRRRSRPHIPKNDLSSEAVLIYSDLNDRVTRIQTVLEAKPEATIKDITDIITDVSAKTIQRDLNSLIDSGKVIRQGERRWSKYSLLK